MGDFSEVVQKYFTSLCSYLEQHVDKWRQELQYSETAIRALCNQAEQLRHVEKFWRQFLNSKSNCTYFRTFLNDMENFQDTKDKLKYRIYDGIELEMVVIKEVIDRLSKTNNTLKSKLCTLERSTLDLYWEDDDALVKGSAIQPPLSKILIYGLDFWQYFHKHFQNIFDSFKCLDVKCETSVASLATAFDVDLEEKNVRQFLAITQYVNNVKSIN